MKKFSLLALVAAASLSFTGAAFAGELALGDYGTATSAGSQVINNGAVAEKATTAYYLDATTKPGLDFGVDVKAASTTFDDSPSYSAAIGSDVLSAKGSNPMPTNSSPISDDIAFTIPQDKMDFANGVTVTLAANNNSAVVDSVELKINAKEVSFDLTPVTYTVKNGDTANKTVNVALQGGLFDATFKANLKVMNGTTDVTSAGLDGLTFDVSGKKGVVIGGKPTTSKTYNLTLVSDESAGDDLTVAEKSGGTAIAVAGKVAKGTVVAKIEITVVDYTVDPQTATWAIGTSDDVVSLDVDMKYADFGCVSTDLAGFELLVTSADKAGTTDSYVSTDIVISADTTHAVISLDKTLLSEMAGAIRASQGDYVNINEEVKVNVVDNDGKFATMTITFTRSADQRPQPPQDGNVVSNDIPSDVTPSTNLVTKKPNNGTSADIDASRGFVESDFAVASGVTKLSNSALDKVATSPVVAYYASQLTSLAIVSQDVQTPGNYALITFDVAGSDLVSGDRLAPSHVDVYKVVSSNDVRNIRGGFVSSYKTLLEHPADGRYTIISADQTGTLNTVFKGENYRLVITIKDGGNYDLNDADRIVADPLVVAASTPKSDSSSSSCDMGFGAAALAGLAVLALRKRSK